MNITYIDNVLNSLFFSTFICLRLLHNNFKRINKNAFQQDVYFPLVDHIQSYPRMVCHLRAVNILSFYYNDEEKKIIVSPLCEVSLFIGTQFTTATSLRKVKINLKRAPIPQSQDRFEIKLNLGNLLHFLFIEEVSNFCHNF